MQANEAERVFYTNKKTQTYQEKMAEKSKAKKYGRKELMNLKKSEFYFPKFKTPQERLDEDPELKKAIELF